MTQPAGQLPPASYTYDVFIPYSTKDKEWVRGEWLRRLEKAGLKCCIDYRDFRLEAPAIKELERAATTSWKTLLVLTPHYLQSKWTEFERYLLQTPDPLNSKFRIIPLLEKPCNLPPSISYLTYLNFDVQLFLAKQALARGERSQALAYARQARTLATCDGGEHLQSDLRRSGAAVEQLEAV